MTASCFPNAQMQVDRKLCVTTQTHTTFAPILP